MRALLKDSIRSIQLEPTSRCNLDCVTCLKPAFLDSWNSHDMDSNLFSRILSQIQEDKPAVHLQGWGESLLHGEMLKFISDLKGHGISVTLTSNGTIATKILAGDLVQSGIDGLTFSMAGSCRETQDPLRGKGSFALLEDSVCNLVSAKRRLGSMTPRLAVSYLLTKQALTELPEAIAWCGKRGVDAFVTVTTTQVVTPAQKALSFDYDGGTSGRHKLLRIRANLRALLHGVRLEMVPFSPTLTPVCAKDPLHSLFISSRGDVSPCVFLCPPIDGGVCWQYGGKMKYIQPLVFGNLKDLTLREIWEGDEYRRFRRMWQMRLDRHEEKLSKVSYSIAGSSELEKAVAEITDYFTSHPVPHACRCCAKQDGF